MSGEQLVGTLINKSGSCTFYHCHDQQILVRYSHVQFCAIVPNSETGSHYLLFVL